MRVYCFHKCCNHELDHRSRWFTTPGYLQTFHTLIPVTLKWFLIARRTSHWFWVIFARKGRTTEKTNQDNFCPKGKTNMVNVWAWSMHKAYLAVINRRALAINTVKQCSEDRFSYINPNHELIRICQWLSNKSSAELIRYHAISCRLRESKTKQQTNKQLLSKTLKSLRNDATNLHI